MQRCLIAEYISFHVANDQANRLTAELATKSFELEAAQHQVHVCSFYVCENVCAHW
jgi:hypothetical protein